MPTMLLEGKQPTTGNTTVDNYPTFAIIPKTTRVPLWHGHYYMGTVTCTVGEGGCGKGVTAIDIGARVILGALMPGEDESTTRDRSPRRVLGVWPEDDANEDLAFRWEEAFRHVKPEITEAELAKALTLVTNMTESLDDNPFTLDKAQTSLKKMQAVIRYYSQTPGEIPVGYVIIDPLLAVTDDSLATNRAARRVIGPIMRMAKGEPQANPPVHALAINLTHHTTKDGQIAGSKGVTDVLRLVYMAHWDPEIEGVVILTKTKGNNVGIVPQVRYTITGEEQKPHVDWILPKSAEQLTFTTPGGAKVTLPATPADQIAAPSPVSFTEPDDYSAPAGNDEQPEPELAGPDNPVVAIYPDPEPVIAIAAEDEPAEEPAKPVAASTGGWSKPSANPFEWIGA